MARSKNASTPEKQALILWALLAKDNAAAFQKELKPEPDKADRDALEKRGLIRSEKRGRYHQIWIEVTDQGWDWAGKNLSASLPNNSAAGCEILRDWLMRLQTFMQTRGLVLADILAPRGQTEEKLANGQLTVCATGAVDDYGTLRRRIREAYLDTTKGRLNTRALLSNIRIKLKDIDRATLDEALKRMQRDEEASLYQLDNRAEITDADRAAAIHFAGEPRHILWIER